MKKPSMRLKKGLLITFSVLDALLIPLSILFLIFLLPLGLICVAVCVIYTIAIISIKQSIAGKKPIWDLFREGNKTCKKCNRTYPRRVAYFCPYCAKVRRFKRKYKEQINKYKTQERKENEDEDFWTAWGTLMILDEIFDDD